MPRLLVVGGGLFGSQAAAYARSKGIEALVFDPALPEAASPVSAGMFAAHWVHGKFLRYHHHAVPLLEQLYGIRTLKMARENGEHIEVMWVPPALVLEPAPVREMVTTIGDGWLEAAGIRYEGWVYIAAGVWCDRFLADLDIHARIGASYIFEGETPARSYQLGPNRRVLSFVRDPGTTWFSDETSELVFTEAQERESLGRAAAIGLTGTPQICRGRRPYVPGGPVFRRLGNRTWLATGGRKLGTVMGASYARRLVEEELRG
jgi:glycine/D-amino acid oxidase-like deaminating enzyme